MASERTRRDLLGQAARGAVGAAVMLSARSYGRVIGANDRINIGFLGCGDRSRGHRNMVRMSQKTRNLGVVAVCDLWKLNREKAASDCAKRLGAEVKQFQYSEDMLALPELDAVMIATGQSDDSQAHLDNWIDCIRNPGRQPNGHIHTGFWHAIGAIMATRAYREGRKLYWDRRREEIVDQPAV